MRRTPAILPDPDIVQPDEIQDTFGRRVAIAIAAVGLLGAVVGYLQADALAQAEASAGIAQDRAAEAMSSQVVASRDVRTKVDLLAIAMEERARAANSRARSWEAAEPGPASLDDEQLWRELSEATREKSGVPRTHSFGPELDPSFPYGLGSEAELEPARVWAAQDGHNEASTHWAERGASLTAALAIVAVGLYLLGLSLSLPAARRRAKRGFAYLGVALGVAAGAVAANVVLGSSAPPGEDRIDAAADAYARGHVALLTGTLPEHFEQARGAYDDAIRERPNFVRAYIERAAAVSNLGSSQDRSMGSGLSIVSDEALDAALSDVQLAYDIADRSRSRGLDPRVERAAAAANLGFYLFLKGLQPGHESRLSESIRYSEEASEIRPEDPIPILNAAAAHLALGRTDAALAVYDRALRVPAMTTGSGAGEIRVSALTDLEILKHRRADLAASIGAAKEFVVASADADAGTEADDASVDDIVLDIFPSELQWTATLDGVDVESDSLFVAWYNRGSADEPWSAVPRVSGRANINEDVEPSRSWDSAVFLASGSLRCLPAGQYRAEFYVNGRLVAESQASEELQAFEAVTSPAIEMAGCVPSGWQISDVADPGFVEGRESPEGDRALYMIRFRPGRAETDLDELPEHYIRLAVERLADRLPDVGDEPLSAIDDPYLLGHDRALAWYWESPGDLDTVWSAASVDDAGAVYVALVVGPDADFRDGGLGLELIKALVSIDP